MLSFRWILPILMSAAGLSLATPAPRHTALDDGTIAPVFYKCKPGIFALTFDDGPSLYTRKLIDTLKKHNVPATFFVLLESILRDEATYTKYLQEMYANGWQIAMHGETHKSLTEMEGVEVQGSLMLLNNKLKEIIGVFVNWMRPPYGNFNDLVLRWLGAIKVAVAMWTSDSLDWKYADRLDEAHEIVQNALRLGDGNGAPITIKDGVILLQHDIHEFSVDLVEEIILKIKDLEFTFATVADCVENGPPAYRDDPSDSAKEPIKVASFPDDTKSEKVKSGAEKHVAAVGLAFLASFVGAFLAF